MKLLINLTLFLACTIFWSAAKAQFTIDLVGHYGLSSLTKNSHSKFNNVYQADYVFNGGRLYGVKVGLDAPIFHSLSLYLRAGINHVEFYYSETLEYEGMGYNFIRNDFTALANYAYADLGLHYRFFQRDKHTLKATASLGMYYMINAGFYHSQIRKSYLYGEETAIRNFQADDEDINRGIQTLIPKAGILYKYRLSPVFALIGGLELGYEYRFHPLYPRSQVGWDMYFANINAGVRVSIPSFETRKENRTRKQQQRQDRREINQQETPITFRNF